MATSLAYRRLLDRLVSLEPHTGYTRCSQIGPLSRTDLSTVLLHDASILGDAVASDAFLNSVVMILAEENFNSLQTSALIGGALLNALTEQAKTYLLEQAQDECARDQQIVREYANERRQVLSLCDGD